MSAYRDALRIDAASAESRVDLAIELLQNCEGVVLWEGTVALRAEPDRILCEVIDGLPETRKSPNEYEAMIKRSREGLMASALRKGLGSKPQEWIVVDDYGMGTRQCWPAI